MANMNSRNRHKILNRYSSGEVFVCSICYTAIYRSMEPKAIIDHKDNFNENNKTNNLQIICRSCNRKKNPKRYKPKRIQTQSEATNQRSEKPWRAWIITQVHNAKTGYSVDEAIHSGAELFGISPETIERRYLPKITSKAGPLLVDNELLYAKPS